MQESCSDPIATAYERGWTDGLAAGAQKVDIITNHQDNLPAVLEANVKTLVQVNETIRFLNNSVRFYLFLTTILIAVIAVLLVWR